MISAVQSMSCYKYSHSEKVQMDTAFRDQYPVTKQTITKEEAGLIDLKERNAKQSIKSMKLDSDGHALSAQETETYLIKDKLYTKMDGKWTKSMVSEAIKPFAFDEQNKLKGLADLIKGSDIEVIGTETVDGQECYKLKVKPDLDTARSILAAQAFTVQSSVPGSLPVVRFKDLSESDPLLRNADISYTVWLTADKHIPKKMVGEMSFALTPDSMKVGSKGEPNFRIDADVEDTLILSDFDAIDDIDNMTVPDEAEGK